MNIGDPVQLDFGTPRHVKEALMETINQGENSYSTSEGLLELREAICEKEKKINDVDIPPEDVIVTQ